MELPEGFDFIDLQHDEAALAAGAPADERRLVLEHASRVVYALEADADGALALVRVGEVSEDMQLLYDADAAEADGLSLEGGRDRAAGPLPPDGLSGLVHGALLASILVNLGVHEIEAGSPID